MNNRKRRISEELKKRGYIKYNYKYKTKKKKPSKQNNIFKPTLKQILNLDDAKNEFLTKIIPYFRLNDDLQYWQVPSKEKLLKRGFNDFLISLENLHINYRKFVYDLNLVIAKSKWSEINRERAASKLKEILTPSLRKKLNLKPNEGPSKKQLENLGYGDFIYAIYNHNLFLSEIVDIVGLNPHPKDAAQEAGINAHWILEMIFLQCTREKNLHSYYEIYPSILHHKKHADNSILRNSNFKQKIEANQSVLKIPNSIRLINIDYYSGSDIETIIRKCKKDYQGEGKFLIIVSLSTQKKNIKTPNVPYRENVRIMNTEEFSKFMGYKGQDLNEYTECIKINRKAPWN